MREGIKIEFVFCAKRKASIGNAFLLGSFVLGQLNFSMRNSGAWEGIKIEFVFCAKRKATNLVEVEGVEPSSVSSLPLALHA